MCWSPWPGAGLQAPGSHGEPQPQGSAQHPTLSRSPAPRDDAHIGSGLSVQEQKGRDEREPRAALWVTVADFPRRCAQEPELNGNGGVPSLTPVSISVLIGGRHGPGARVSYTSQQPWGRARSCRPVQNLRPRAPPQTRGLNSVLFNFRFNPHLALSFEKVQEVWSRSTQVQEGSFLASCPIHPPLPGGKSSLLKPGKI